MAADHIIATKVCPGIDSESTALVVYDEGTQWIGAYPSVSKGAEYVTEAFNHFKSPKEKVQLFYSDNAGEINQAAREAGWRHAKSTPYRSETNGIVERQIRTVCEGTRSLLEQSGFDEAMWPVAMKYFCHAHNI